MKGQFLSQLSKKDKVLFVLIILIVGVLHFFSNLYSNYKDDDLKSKQVIQNYIDNFIPKIQDEFKKLLILLEIYNKQSAVKSGSFQNHFLLKHYTIQDDSYSKDLKIEIKEFYGHPSIYLNYGFRKIVVNIEELKDIFTNTLPKYVHINITDEKNLNSPYKVYLIKDKLFVTFEFDQRHKNESFRSILFQNLIKSIVLGLLLTLSLVMGYIYLSKKVYASLITSLNDTERYKNDIDQKYTLLNEQYKNHILKSSIEDKINTLIFSKLIANKTSLPIEAQNIPELREMYLKKELLIAEQEEHVVDFSSLIKDLECYFQDQVQIKNIKITTDYNTSLIKINITKEALYQILFSLFDNRIRGLGEKQNNFINLSIKEQKAQLIISIIDSGFDMPIERVDEYCGKAEKSTNLFILGWSDTQNSLSINGCTLKFERKNGKNHIVIKTAIKKNLVSDIKNVCFIEDYKQ